MALPNEQRGSAMVPRPSRSTGPLVGVLLWVVVLSQAAVAVGTAAAAGPADEPTFMVTAAVAAASAVLVALAAWAVRGARPPRALDALALAALLLLVVALLATVVVAVVAGGPSALSVAVLTVAVAAVGLQCVLGARAVARRGARGSVAPR